MPSVYESVVFLSSVIVITKCVVHYGKLIRDCIEDYHKKMLEELYDEHHSKRIFRNLYNNPPINKIPVNACDECSESKILRNINVSAQSFISPPSPIKRYTGVKPLRKKAKNFKKRNSLRSRSPYVKCAVNQTSSKPNQTSQFSFQPISVCNNSQDDEKEMSESTYEFNIGPPFDGKDTEFFITDPSNKKTE